MARSERLLFSIGTGLKWALPIMLGYVPIGMAFGLLAQQNGLEMGPTLGMSIFVFAGASQFTAALMLRQGMSALLIIGTTFIINFRHVLMSASLAPKLGGEKEALNNHLGKSPSLWKTWQKILLGVTLTDEAFAILSVRFAQNGGSPMPDPISAITLNFNIYVTWVLSGLTGHRMGSLIEHPEAWGLDFALPAILIGLLVSTCGTRRPAVTAAFVGGAAAVALHLLGAGSAAVFLGALAGATAGLFVKEDAS